ncbi:dynamin family protein [Evansella sp. AB-rgal1]|uniref:dynamin family protein n=1 Tax=Evansella sp. AB-rgal1 TaxID=3242696 RepID=UPI00359DFA86
MREVFIKYNPYKVETDITISGNAIKANSALQVDDRRLQEWVEDLPKILVDECNTKRFKITFHGTVLDFEDLHAVAKGAEEEGIFITCEHIQAKEVKDKEKSIEKIFRDIQKGPFEELKQKDLENAFKLASTSDFEVNVIATMSAGKSTLINALLRQKLMPAMQEACTATITKIRDKESDNFTAKVYNLDGELVDVKPNVTYEMMQQINSTPTVSNIDVEGNIPFVSSDDVSLVLVDTPGPNNSRDLQHKTATYRMLSESSKNVVLYLLNATQLAVNDDNDLLNHVADSMRVGGKQSKDRFIFVVNKLDDYKRGEDSVEGSINKVRKYLEDKGIMDPNIFPAAALPALNIRTLLKDVDPSKLQIDEIEDDDVYDAIGKMKKLNRNNELHFEKYAPLPNSARVKVENQLTEAQEAKDSKTEALIHSGVISIEAAISMYVEKYAKTTKIKNIVDTFSKKLESAKSFEKTKQELVTNKDKQQGILRQIESIQENVNNVEEAKKFQNEIDNINFNDQVELINFEVIEAAQGKIKTKIDAVRGLELPIEEVRETSESFDRFTRQLEAEVQFKLEQMISNHVQQTAEALVDTYRKKTLQLSKELSSDSLQINPLELLDGDIASSTSSAKLIESLSKTKQVDTGETTKEKNPEREGFLGFFKVWKSWNVEKPVYKQVNYVRGDEFASQYFSSLQVHLLNLRDDTVAYAMSTSEDIKDFFMEKFNELDVVLNGKLAELEACATDNSQLEDIIKENEARIQWLEEIQNRVTKILEI